MKKKKAKKLSIKRWKAIVKNNGKEYNIKQYVTKGMQSSGDDCAYCYKYSFLEGGCENCPLSTSPRKSETYHCLLFGHPFNNWFNGGKTVEQAKVVLQMIKDN